MEGIIYEDDEVAVINKPAGLLSIPGRGTEPSVLEYLRKAGKEDWLICHRLDKETSGVLVFAKTTQAHKDINGFLARRELPKTYWAVVEGRHALDNHGVDLPLKVTRSGHAAVNRSIGKEAVTVFNTLEQFDHFTLVECKPITGRLHQIRAHLSRIDAPIASDDHYGGHPPMLSRIKKNYSSNKSGEEKPMITRVALHAKSLDFQSLSYIKRQVEAPLPKDFEVFLKLLRKYDK
jgi:23S rRNA pseudouridine955/2504/2580 synthase